VSSLTVGVDPCAVQARTGPHAKLIFSSAALFGIRSPPNWLSSSAVSHCPVLWFSAVGFHFLSDRVISVLPEFDVCSRGSAVRSGLNLSAAAPVF
jgi:hypothetical protein